MTAEQVPGAGLGSGLRPEDLLSAFDHAPTGMAVVLGDGTMIAANAALGALVGRPVEALVGTTLFALTDPDDLASAREACATIGGGMLPVVRHECRFLRPDGAVRWVLVSSSRLPRDGRGLRIVLHVEDITERKALEARLRRQALHDPLTGLPNRTLLLDRMEHALAAGRRSGLPVTLLFLDLDGFKTVNDTLGHEAGDRLLTALARRVEGLLRPGDTAARLGGDEFVVLCPETGASDGEAVAQRLREAAAEEFDLGTATVRLSASVGSSVQEPVELVGDPAEEALSLLRRADRRMYDDKLLHRA